MIGRKRVDNFAGRVAVVTGGANGIGLGLTKRFLKEGMKVVVADIDQPVLDNVVADLSAHGEVIAVRTDVSKFGNLEALADAAVAAFGHVHILCNNAGVGGHQKFSNTSLETWEWTLGVDLWGVIYGCKAFLPILARQDEAHIINTASMAGFTSAPYLLPYCVSKAGVVALSEGLARELETEMPNVTVSVLCPAFVATAIADDERNAPQSHAPRSTSDPELDHVREAQRVGLSQGKSPDEVADIVMGGIRDRRMHIFTHPEWTSIITNRAELIKNGLPVSAPVFD